MKKNNVVICGAGLCGTLLAIRLAQRGVNTTLIEKRPDMRKATVAAGRSINLALSNRGLRALELIGIKEEVLKSCIPMKGRMIHTTDGSQRFSHYSGRASNQINSVPRGGLNMTLLDKAETYDNLTLLFDTPCQSISINDDEVVLVCGKGQDTQTLQPDAVIGADGAGSSVRKSMSDSHHFTVSQDFLSHGYKELTIPPGPDGSFLLDQNALHIWPRGQFMVIALPNPDGSFTVTAFFPNEGPNSFAYLNSEERVTDFFEEYFAGLLPYCPDYLEDYFKNPVGRLGTISCAPWQVGGRVVLMGDAAHAIVPFYGQGMNASFEDVVVFDQLLDQYSDDWSKLLEAFSKQRKPNADAIAALALDNFYEMQDHVIHPGFVKKRKLEMQLEKNYPDYHSKYSLVTFCDHIPYSIAKELGRKQDQLLLELCAGEDSLSLDSVISKVNSLKQLYL